MDILPRPQTFSLLSLWSNSECLKIASFYRRPTSQAIKVRDGSRLVVTQTFMRGQGRQGVPTTRALPLNPYAKKAHCSFHVVGPGAEHFCADNPERLI